MLPNALMALTNEYVDRTMHELLHEYLEPRLIRDVIGIIDIYTSYFIYDHWGLVTPYMLTQSEFVVPRDRFYSRLSLPATTLLNRLRLVYETSKVHDITIFSTETLHNIVLTNLEKYMEQYEAPPELDLSTDEDNIKLKAMVKHWLYKQDREWLIGEVERLRYNEEMNSSANATLPISNLLNGIWFQGNWDLLSDSDLKLIARCYGAITYGPSQDDRNTMIRRIVETQTSLVRELAATGMVISLYRVNVVELLLHPWKREHA